MVCFAVCAIFLIFGVVFDGEPGLSDTRSICRWRRRYRPARSAASSPITARAYAIVPAMTAVLFRALGRDDPAPDCREGRCGFCPARGLAGA